MCKTKSSTVKTVFVGNDKDLVWNRHFFGANIHPDFHCDVVIMSQEDKEEEEESDEE